MKNKLKGLMKMFFELKSIRRIKITKEISLNEKWITYHIEFNTPNNKSNN